MTKFCIDCKFCKGTDPLYEDGMRGGIEYHCQHHAEKTINLVTGVITYNSCSNARMSVEDGISGCFVTCGQEGDNYERKTETIDGY